MPLLVVTSTAPQEGFSIVCLLILSGNLILFPLGLHFRNIVALSSPWFLNKFAAGFEHILLGLPNLNIFNAGLPLQIHVLTFLGGVVAAFGFANRRPGDVVGIVLMQLLQLLAIIQQLLPAHPNNFKSIAA